MNNKKLAKTEKWMKIELTKILKVKVKNSIFSDITITDIKLTSDLTYATVNWYAYCQNDSKIDDITKELEKVKGFCRKELSQISSTYKIPQLRFKYDVNIDKANRIEEILNQIKEGQNNKS